jgi:NitT/TauT family transport system substrate-binding protein
MPRLLLLSVLGLILWAQVHPARSFAQTSESAKIIVSFPAPTITTLPFDVAVDRGFYKREGFEVLRLLLRSGPTAVQALVSGSTQFSTAFGAGTRAAMAGAPVKGLLSFSDKPTFSLYARKESGVSTGRDLKNKKIAVTSLGSSTDFAARTILTHYKLDPDKDATILAVGAENIFPALTGGSVDAAVLWPPIFAQAEKLGMVRVHFLRDLFRLPDTGLVTSDRLINEKPAYVKSFLRATLRGFQYVHDPKNKADMVNYLVKNFNLEKDVAEANYSFMLSNLSEDGRISKVSIDNFINIARQRVKSSETNESLSKKMYAFHLLEEVLKAQ